MANKLCRICNTNPAGWESNTNSPLCKPCRDVRHAKAEEARAKYLAPPTSEEMLEITDIVNSGRLEEITGVTNEEPIIEPEPEDELKYPALRFPYEALPEGRLKDLTDKACEGGLSPGLIVPAILTLVSALPFKDKMEHARINLMVTLLALVGAGKDTAINRALNVLGMEDTDHYVTYTPSGERSISTLLGDHPATAADPIRRAGPKTKVILTYELEDTLNKSRGETSSVLQALQWFYDNNRKVFADSRSRQIQTVDCRLSWLTALPVGDTEIDESEFRRAFGANSTHGLSSRMLFGFAEVPFDRRKSRAWEVDRSTYTFGEVKEVFIEGVGPVTSDRVETLVDIIRSHEVKGWAPGVEALYLNWKPVKDLSGRDTYHILKIAILTALVNGHIQIERTDWDFAVSFMAWQMEIRLAFAPGRAKQITMGEFNETIVKEMEKRTAKQAKRDGNTANARTFIEDGNPRHYIRWKAMVNDGKWYGYGWDAEKVIKTLVRIGTLVFKQELEMDPSGSGKNERMVPNEAWVRLSRQKGGS